MNRQNKIIFFLTSEIRAFIIRLKQGSLIHLVPLLFCFRENPENTQRGVSAESSLPVHLFAYLKQNPKKE